MHVVWESDVWVLEFGFAFAYNKEKDDFFQESFPFLRICLIGLSNSQTSKMWPYKRSCTFLIM